MFPPSTTSTSDLSAASICFTIKTVVELIEADITEAPVEAGLVTMSPLDRDWET